MNSPALQQLNVLAAAIDAVDDFWRFPEEGRIRGFLGTSDVFIVGDQPSTSSWSRWNPGRRAFYDTLMELGLEDAHLTDLYKRRGRAGQLKTGLPDDFDEHVRFFRQELSILRPTRVVSIGQLAHSLLLKHVPEISSQLSCAWHFAYVVRSQRTHEYAANLGRAVGLQHADDPRTPVRLPAKRPVPQGDAGPASTLVARVPAVPTGVRPRSWTLRRDNNAHHHGVVDISESPLYLDLHWRETRIKPVHHVGLFRLDLPGLLAAHCIRHDPAGIAGPRLRLRIVLKPGPRFHVQVKDGAPSVVLPD